VKKWKPKMRKRADGRHYMKQADLPMFAEKRDLLPNPVEWDGRRMCWVGIGYVDERPARGDEPLVILPNKD
jgi:hypothetical protein